MVCSIGFSSLLFLFLWQGGRRVGICVGQLVGLEVGIGLTVKRHGGRRVGCLVVGL